MTARFSRSDHRSTLDETQSGVESVDTRALVSSILAIELDPERGLLDLTSFLQKDTFLKAGGFGEVYRAKWLNRVSEEQVQLLPSLVMKVMRVVSIGDESTRKKREKYLKREIKLLRDLLHPNILSLVGYVLLENDCNQPCLISSFVPNGALHCWLTRCIGDQQVWAGNVREYSIKCNMIRLCDLMLGIANGLSYLHAHKIVHGDLKSVSAESESSNTETKLPKLFKENVLIDLSGMPKIIDFGLSRLMDDSLLWQTSSKGDAPGTLRWQSPELINGNQKSVTLESDIYAFGMTCWEILEGEIPFLEYRSQAEVIFAVLDRKERPRRPRRRDHLDDVWHMIEACWAEQPESRPSLEPIIHVLSHVFQQESYAFRRRYTPMIYHNMAVASNHIIMSFPESTQWKEEYLWENREALCEEGELQTLVAVGHLAWIRGNQGRWEEAVELEELLLNAWKALEGEKGKNTRIAMANLASTYLNLWRLEQAEKLLSSLLQEYGDELGHEDTLRAMAGQAESHVLHKRLDDAEQLLLKVKSGMTDIFGENHLETLACMSRIATVLTAQRRLKEAEDLGLKVTAALKRALGDSHPDTLTSMSLLELVYGHQERWEEAEELARQIVIAREQVLGKNHPETLGTMVQLAVACCNNNRWKDAERLYMAAWDARERVLGPNHPDTLWTMASLVVTHINLEQWNEGEQLCLKALEARERVLGEGNLDTLWTRETLGFIYCKQRRWEDARELHMKVLNARVHVLGENHPETLRTMENFASVYASLLRWEEATELLLKVATFRREQLGEGHPDTLESIRDLSSASYMLESAREVEVIEL